MSIIEVSRGGALREEVSGGRVLFLNLVVAERGAVPPPDCLLRALGASG